MPYDLISRTGHAGFGDARLAAAMDPLASNENPFPPLPGVLRAVLEQSGWVNRYPDRQPSQLIDALAECLDVPAEHITTGCGSVAVAQQLVQAAVRQGQELLFAWRSFETYPRLARINGARPVQVPLRDGYHDLAAMAAAITDRTAAVIVCNPNNPTGTLVDPGALARFVAEVPDRVLVVIDEAYAEFADRPGQCSGIELYRRHRNVAVMRTFSKAYGLAGLRVGYSVSHCDLAEKARLCSVPFGVSAAAQAAAVASLLRQDEVRSRVELLVAERERVAGELRRLGWPVPASQANFLWLPLGDRAEAFDAACAVQGIRVRTFAGEGVRVSIGRRATNDVLLGVARGFTMAGLS